MNDTTYKIMMTTAVLSIVGPLAWVMCPTAAARLVKAARRARLAARLTRDPSTPVHVHLKADGGQEIRAGARNTCASPGCRHLGGRVETRGGF